MTDPRNGLSRLPDAARPGGEPSFNHQVLPPLRADERLVLERIDQAAVARWAWTELGIVLDLLTEKFVGLEAVHGTRWRANCRMCGLTSYVDLRDQSHVAHDRACIIGRMLRERNAFEKLFGKVLVSLSQPERRPDTPDRHLADEDLSAGTPSEPAADQPSPAPVVPLAIAVAGTVGVPR